MEHDPILELAGQILRWRGKSDGIVDDIETIIERLCTEDVARRITDRSIDAVTSYIEWSLQYLPETTPSPDSDEMFLGLLVGKGNWSGRLMKARTIGIINYHAARLYASPDVFARAAYTLATVYRRMGMDRVALPLYGKAANAIRESQNSELLVSCFIRIAELYTKQHRQGKAWNYIAAALPLAIAVSPWLRGFLWYKAGECLHSLHRYDEAGDYYKRIVAMPEAAEIPSPVPHRDAMTGKPSSRSLREDASLAMFSADFMKVRGLVSFISSDYTGLRPDGPVTLTIETPLGFRRFLCSSYHELYDRLQYEAGQLLAIRRSISWRGSASSYLRGWFPLLESLIQTALKISLPHRALEWLEAVKAITLLQRLSVRGGPCPEGIDPNEWARLEELVRRYRMVIESENETVTSIGERVELSAEELEGAIRHLVGGVRYKNPHLPLAFGVLTDQHKLPEPAAFENLPSHTRIIEYFYGASSGGCWIIDPAKPEQPVWVDLPGLTHDAATMVTRQLVEALVACEQARARSIRNSGALTSATLNPLGAVDTAVAFARDVALRPLLEKYLRPEGIRHVVLIPYRALHILPFHAAVEPDELIVTYAPSLTVLANLQRPPDPNRTYGVIIADSLPDCPQDLCADPPHSCWRLPGARVEGDYVRRILEGQGYDAVAAYGPSATMDWVEEQISRAHILHMSLHGIFDPTNPANSGLMVAPRADISSDERAVLWALNHAGRPVTVPREVFCYLWSLQRIWQHANLLQSRLVFLAGCETSVVHWDDAVEEFLGLPNGFLQAGAATVIGSLWVVGDLCALLLTRQFYHLLLEGGRCPSVALAEAQSWLRTLTVQQMLKDYPDVIMDCYKLVPNAKPCSAKRALEDLLDWPQDELLCDEYTPFASPFFSSPFRCIGLP
jgi:CHAT domain-containing protein/tetratricopeptide (TPR) repeat protein